MHTNRTSDGAGKVGKMSDAGRGPTWDTFSHAEGYGMVDNSPSRMRGGWGERTRLLHVLASKSGADNFVKADAILADGFGFLEAEPSDAQVLTALNVFYSGAQSSTLADYGEQSVEAMRAALRAAVHDG